VLAACRPRQECFSISIVPALMTRFTDVIGIVVGAARVGAVTAAGIYLSITIAHFVGCCRFRWQQRSYSIPASPAHLHSRQCSCMTAISLIKPRRSSD
jgi:hypothetical protein